MNNPTPQITNTKFIELLKTYWAWRRLWIGTTVVFGGIGLIYVLFLKNDMWTAAQGLIVRDEANGAVMRLGRFQSQTEMKAAQETILEMARNTQVLREALLEVGPAKSLFSLEKTSESWPTQREVSELAEDAIGVRAPQGAEFGTTEVIYLDIKQHTRDRALALNRAVCKALDNRLRQVRVARADGVINELVRASTMATEDLKKASEQLQIVEREAGADLADLRGLSESNGNGSAARTQLENVKTELRQVETQHATLQSDLALLKETQADPDRILSAPATILSAHPGLRKLREGLADAQLNTSQLRGRFTSTHPMVNVAISAEGEIKQQLRSELALATGNSAREVAVSQARLDKLKRQQQQLEERLERLARIRTEHEQLNQEVRSRTKILQDAERQLADTRAARDAALTTSLLTRIDDPVLGERPVGPGRTTILAAMTMAGLCFGMGIVFLLTPLDGTAPDSNRWNEQLGRRLSDRFPWLADRGPNGAPRRRRNDVERRQPGTNAPRTGEAAGRGRRQSDTAMAAINPAMVAPQIREEDACVSSRLDDMLMSELAAMAPVPVERQVANVSAELESPTNNDPVSALAAPITAQPEPAKADAAPADSKAGPREKEPVRPRLRAREGRSTKELSTKESSSLPNPKPLQKPEAPISRAPQTQNETAPASPAPTPVAAGAESRSAKAVVDNKPEATKTDVRKSELNNLEPGKPQTKPAGENKRSENKTSENKASEKRSGESKPVMNLFKPNQAINEAAPQKPRPAGLNPPGEPSKPAPLPAGFETPIEGGLAGIGLPTQKLPDSYQFRQGSN